MEITLKSISINQSLSDETLCFSANVYVNGVKAFAASNRGCGGPNMYHAIKGYKGPSIDEVEAHIKEHFPKFTHENYEPLDCSLDIVVGDLLNADLLRKDLQKLVRTRMVTIEPNDKGGEEVKTYKFKGKFTADQINSFCQQHLALGNVKGDLVNGSDANFERALAIMSAEATEWATA